MSAPREPVRAFQLLLHHPAVRALTEAADAEGAHAELVGGILRDRFLGLRSRDVDAMVSRRGGAIAERLAEALSARLVHLGGKQFAAYRLVVHDRGDGRGGYVLDLWDRQGASLQSDLARRDFTVNAIALSTPRGELHDPFGGFGDLRRRRLRATTPRSFSGDPLRVLRLARLLVQLPGFSIAPPTLELARPAASALASVASERVREELEHLFSKPEPAPAVALLEALDLYPGLWLGRPGEPTKPDGSVGGGTGDLCRELAKLAPRALLLRQLAGGKLSTPVRHRLGRIGLTFAHLPSLVQGTDPMSALEQFSEAGYLTRRDAAAVRTILRWEQLPTDESGRRRFLHETGDLWSTAACFAGVRTPHGWADRASELAQLDERAGDAIREPPQLLDGTEIGRLLGIEPGPAIGRAVRALRDAQVEGRVTTEEEARQLVEELEIRR